MNYLLHLTDPAATDCSLTGGKGANLARLTQQGFPVPPAFIITAAAYRDFLRGQGGLEEAICALPIGDAAQLQKAAAQFRNRLAELPLPAALDSEVREALAQFSPDQSFAVRSSSTLEDLSGAAFAGQHDTYLNVTGIDALLDRIKACFISLWHDRAIAYRHQQGYDRSAATMAVVVQQLIPCEIAGVGFTINPVSGDLGEMVIDANYGLGESVVGGEAGVDHFELGKADRRVRRRQLARKTEMIIQCPGGTTRVATPDELMDAPCLTDEQLDELATLLLRVEQSYRFPQDTEWGFAGGKLFLLQARPVTAIPARWTRDESAERFPNVISPLTWDFVESGFHRSLAHSFQLMGYPACHGKWFSSFGHYIYGNQNLVDLYLKRPPFVARSLEELRAAIPRLREEYRWVQELPVQWMRELDYYLLGIGRFLAEPLNEKTIPELWDHVLAVNEHGAEYFKPNIAISITHGTLHHLLHRLLRMFTGADADRLFDGLMAYCETKTGVINEELYELARLVRATPALDKAMASLTSREFIAQGMTAQFPEFGARLDRFLRDHGHREMDFDAHSPTWSEVPWVVLDNLKLILQTPMDRSPADRARELKLRTQQAELELFQRIPADLHFFFYEILRLARIYTGLDDLEHYHTTRLTPALRRGLHELGSRLVTMGVLDEPMDIFFAHQKQIHDTVRSNDERTWQGFGRMVRAQKADCEAARARKPRWKLDEANEAPAASTSELTGLAGSAGQAEGEVYVVHSEEDFARFPKGAVLVARTTNPTWTPLFYSAAAVITESGGPLSHGAVTAREMRIPAVMSVKDCLTRLTNGQRVRVDGATGRVLLL